MIRWKVTRMDRTSCLINRRSCFCQKYLKGKIVTADPQTPGIFTFQTKQHAEVFMPQMEQLILKVKPLGKGVTPSCISRDLCQRDLMRFFKSLASKLTMWPPNGTICYPAVKVLD